jgi:hypothetical protein
LIDWVQWPAFLVTVFAGWMASSAGKRRRAIGFWCFIASNILWTIWGVSAHAYALIALQVCLAVTNIHGVWKNKS